MSNKAADTRSLYIVINCMVTFNKAVQVGKWNEV
jgi:hypothetical protein